MSKQSEFIAAPWFARLSRLGGRTDTVLVGFSMTLARDDAWTFAQKLAAAPPQQQTLLIAERDKNVARLGELVEHPPGLLLNAINLLIWSREVKNPAIAIALLTDRARTLAEVALDAAATRERWARPIHCLDARPGYAT